MLALFALIGGVGLGALAVWAGARNRLERESKKVLALEAAVDTIRELTVPAIFEHVQRYHDAVEPGIEALGFTSQRSPDPARRSGILSFVPPADLSAPQLPAALSALGVAASIPDGVLRLAPHWPNSLAEASHVVDALCSIRAGAVL